MRRNHRPDLLVPERRLKASDTGGFTDEFKAEAAEMEAILRDLESADTSLDWFYVNPAGGSGPWAADKATGVYRTGDDMLLVDDNSKPNISGADQGKAVVEEFAMATRQRRRFTVSS